MKRQWKEIGREDKRAQWAGIYVTMNSKGVIVLGSAAYEKLGSPRAFLLLYDPGNNSIGLKPTQPAMRNAYTPVKSGRHGGQKIFAYRLVVECGLKITDTLEFHDAEIDVDGILVLNLRTAKISQRALKHPKRQKEEV